MFMPSNDLAYEIPSIILCIFSQFDLQVKIFLLMFTNDVHV
jgi:hypothetical protein